MKEYLLSLIGAALVAALIGILTPEGEQGGIGKHMRLLTSLFLICVLAMPLKDTIQTIGDIINGDFRLPGMEATDDSEYRQEMEDAMEGSSKQYFTQMLTQTLERQFSITGGEVRCEVLWGEEADVARPTRVTVILSGSAIWKNPDQIEDFVHELLGCTCITAIE